MTYWQSILAVCLASLVSAFAVLTRREVIAVLEIVLRDLKCDAQQEDIDADFSGYNRADFDRLRMRKSS